MDEQVTSVLKSRQRWLFLMRMTGYGGTVVAHVFGERTLATLERLRACCRPFEVGIDDDGWPLYESRLKGKLHRYQQALHSAH